jgi:predicted outer membrane repeat protein
MAMLFLSHNIMAGANGAYNCTAYSSSVSSDYNLMENNDPADPCGTPNYTESPLLGTLQDNGGPVFTMRPATGSVVIDGGQPDTCLVPTDARDLPRPQGAACDLGAFEVGCLMDAYVLNNNDNGYGSLRQAILEICAGGVIDFTDPLAGDQTITLTTELLIDKDLTIQNTSSNAVTISGNNTTRVFNIGMGTVNLSNLTITDGNAGSAGGGGMDIGASATVTLNDCTFQNNQATDGGGAINNGGTLTVNRCTFNNNSVYVNFASGGGGAISHYSGFLAVNNSTFVNNAVPNGTNPPGLRGGAIYTQSVAEIYNSTFSGNSVNPLSADPGGAILDNGAGYVIVKNSILYGNTPTDCYGDVGNLPQPNVFVNNLAGIGCEPIISADPLLGPLQNNGGLTPTMALLPGSPAIDAGDNASCLSTDQRGVSRPQGAACDIGAYEAIPLCQAQSQIPLIQCEALKALYDSTNGSAWTDAASNNWFVTTTPCSWAGVTCSGTAPNQMVIGLDRNMQNLSGTIPIELANLSALETLYLHIFQARI